MFIETDVTFAGFTFKGGVSYTDASSSNIHGIFYDAVALSGGDMILVGVAGSSNTEGGDFLIARYSSSEDKFYTDIFNNSSVHADAAHMPRVIKSATAGKYYMTVNFMSGMVEFMKFAFSGPSSVVEWQAAMEKQIIPCLWVI